MKTTVILGTGGRVGAAMARDYAAAGDRVVALDRRALDLSQSERLREGLRALEFHALVNCAALTSPDYCERHEAEAFAVNAEAVGIIAAECREKGARFIHLSTDYVFGGETPGLRTEDDTTSPVNRYGASKLAGEEAALAEDPGALVARVSWVFGQDRPGFVEQIVRGSLEGKRLEAVGDKWSLPTGVDDLCAMLRPFLYEQSANGILHVTQSGEPCSWYDYGTAVLEEAAAAGYPLRTREIVPQRLADLDIFIARRPVHTAMSTARLTALIGQPPRPWREALRAYLREQRRAIAPPQP